MRAGVSSAFSFAWRRTLDLVFPPRCAGCGAFGSFLCEECLAATPRAGPPRCPVCWMPPQAGLCQRCNETPPAFEAARCPFVYGGAAREAVHALKYDGVSALAETMAAHMAACLNAWSPPVEALVPVPLAGGRRRRRGYNQSELLARALSRRLGLPVVLALERRKAGPAQARAADETARRANVAEAFAVRPGREVDGPLLLVDDVMTSGATLDACARTLRHGGLGPAFALTFARED
jgi:ComF family protein